MTVCVGRSIETLGRTLSGDRFDRDQANPPTPLPPGPPVAEKVHWTVIESGGLVKGQAYHAALRYGGQLPVSSGFGLGPGGSQLMANYDSPDFYSGSGPGSDCWRQAAAVVMPTGRWVCAEWAFDGSGDTAAMRLWLDGQEVPSLAVSRWSQCLSPSWCGAWPGTTSPTPFPPAVVWSQPLRRWRRFGERVL
jgi:hypothetical protein